MTRMVDADDLVSAYEIAAIYDVSIGTAYDWALREDFPPPVLTFGKKYRIWLLSKVSEYFDARKPAPVEHGTWQCHRRGCRCPACRAAWAAHMRAYRRRAASPSNSSPDGGS